MNLPVAREGLPFILVFLAAAVLAAIWARSGGWGARTALPAGLLMLTLFVVYFFRDPERRIPADPDVVVSPADGTVMSVREVAGEAAGTGFTGGTATRVTIFLSIFNVHVQRAPLGGRVDGYDYRPGRYLPAWRDEASSENEQASLALATAEGPVVVRQIAGLVARRIVTYPREGDSLERGERIGLIRFGSRVDLFLPPEWAVTVGAGDRVRGGETPVAHINRTGE
ncbi:MAG: phosphatidylserine decarboxylase family protein [Gemmatimonadetes bacterium]|nr:phosphatidylserine decarboxylase family protein [Gemmatimonadota bacterium]MCY3676763.1 phosphatidylserine decarboxylase family protein [Gemmatimonadota bacterium]MYA42865.1 phosphatidylserine decarboxylase family protein [Gemmatimonadota bacterium]MYE93919.1 phosphatidylserine decarboxylase family protein [Gemmatimonadota bacterium]MYJ11408.1 phosphatidylserine decarboxylase family protein [Gemmatimonadota bacterium]